MSTPSNGSVPTASNHLPTASNGLATHTPLYPPSVGRDLGRLEDRPPSQPGFAADKGRDNTSTPLASITRNSPALALEQPAFGQVRIDQRVEDTRAHGLTGRRALSMAAPRPGDHEQAAQGNPVLPLLHGPPHPLNGPMLARFDHSHPRAVSLIDKRVGAKFVTNFRNEKVSGR